MDIKVTFVPDDYYHYHYDMAEVTIDFDGYQHTHYLQLRGVPDDLSMYGDDYISFPHTCDERQAAAWLRQILFACTHPTLAAMCDEIDYREMELAIERDRNRPEVEACYGYSRNRPKVEACYDDIPF